MAATPRYLHLVLMGLVQGLLLHGLYHSYEHSQVPAEFALPFNALLMLTLVLPLLVFWTQDLLSGKLRAILCLSIALIATALGVYQGLTATPVMAGTRIALFGFSTVMAVATAAYICVPMVSGRCHPQSQLVVLGHWDYQRLFDAAWRNAVLSIQALVLTGLFWGILEVGAQLFALIGVEWFRDELLHKSWFAIPLTTTSLALGFRAGLRRTEFTHSLRTHWLTITAWMLVVVSVIGSGFILTALGGVGTLFEKGVSAVFLLWFSAFWIKFYNCAFQNGSAATAIFGPVLRTALSIASLPLLIMVGFAVYAMYLRIDQYGLTTERIWGVLVVTAAVIYALGYAAAVRLRTPTCWMHTLPATNVVAAMVIVFGIVLLLSPLLDPRRLAVDDQLARLASGKVTAATFDVDMLANAGRYGYEKLQQQASERVAQGKVSVLSGRAQQALLDANNRAAYAEDGIKGVLATDLSAQIEIFPSGARVPVPLFEVITKEVASWDDWQIRGSCFAEHAVIKCPLLRMDLNGDGIPEAVLWTERDLDGARMYQEQNGKWQFVAALSRETFPQAADVWTALRKGSVMVKPSPWQDLYIGPLRMDVHEQDLVVEPQVSPADCC